MIHYDNDDDDDDNDNNKEDTIRLGQLLFITVYFHIQPQFIFCFQTQLL